MATPPKKPVTKGKFQPKVEKENPAAKWIKIGLIVVGVGAIIILIATNPKQRQLSCSGSSSINSFGSCTEQ
jgi:hypothetical protein